MVVTSEVEVFEVSSIEGFDGESFAPINELLLSEGGTCDVAGLKTYRIER